MINVSLSKTFFIVVCLIIVIVVVNSDEENKKRRKHAAQNVLGNVQFSRLRGNKYSPENWRKLYKSCGGTKQSPINIEVQETDLRKNTGKILKFSNAYKTIPDKMFLSIQHHQLNLRPDYGKKATPTLTGDLLKGTYKLRYLVFHWGPGKDLKGKEHTFNGFGSLDQTQMDMEIQIVHVNEKYTDEESLKHKDGVVIVSTFYKILENQKDGTSAMDILSSQLMDFLLSEGNEEYSISKRFSIHALINKEMNSFFTYEGSLTYPPCSEVVTWIIGTNQAPMTQLQLDQFRYLRWKDEDVYYNTRPDQHLNGRIVTSYVG